MNIETIIILKDILVKLLITAGILMVVAFLLTLILIAIWED